MHTALATTEPARRLRRRLADGVATTLHVATYPIESTRVGIAVISPPAPLEAWCREHGVEEAMIGGFFIRAAGTPLGELRIDAQAQPSEPFDAPWDRRRSCVHLVDGRVKLAPRERLGELGDGLLQAGPMLVEESRNLLTGGGDPEGFSAGSRQFDSDITEGRYPRAALGLTGETLIAAVCDGRADEDAGMSLAEMAETMIDLSAREAINLDGGGSASLVCGGMLRNRPREEHGYDIPDGRPVSTALVFSPR